MSLLLNFVYLVQKMEQVHPHLRFPFSLYPDSLFSHWVLFFPHQNYTFPVRRFLFFSVKFVN